MSMFKSTREVDMPMFKFFSQEYVSYFIVMLWLATFSHYNVWISLFHFSLKPIQESHCDDAVASYILIICFRNTKHFPCKKMQL
jgi:hypothetical protein